MAAKSRRFRPSFVFVMYRYVFKGERLESAVCHVTEPSVRSCFFSLPKDETLYGMQIKKWLCKGKYIKRVIERKINYFNIMTI